MKNSNRGAGLPTGDGRPIRTYGEGRTCTVCGTPLSRYNESRWCGVHRGWGASADRKPVR